ncbi:MAG: permease-like cell division protein FtsX [Firmicutes bacterium]|nr:ABC transporter permease [Alicyclobacillaceae bacterium]MCL6497519.1 permease-like cell division protein FtsX [Bacillota bacterium]
MKPRTVWYLVREAGQNLWRNGWMTVASVSTVALSLFVLAFFLVLSLNLDHITGVLQSQVEVRVFVRASATRAQEMALLHTAEHWPQVRQIAFFTKEQAAQALKQEFPQEKDLVALINQSNPLLDGYDVYTREVSQIPAVVRRFSAQPIVQNVVYQGEVAQRLAETARVVAWAGYAIEVLLGLATVVIIMNTIRLAVFARRREIQVMKLVGATDWFIRWPFLLEGVALGLLGALVADLATDLGYGWVAAAAARALPFWPLASPAAVLAHAAAVTGAGGIAIGFVGSWAAVHRFLKV